MKTNSHENQILCVDSLDIRGILINFFIKKYKNLKLPFYLEFLFMKPPLRIYLA